MAKTLETIESTNAGAYDIACEEPYVAEVTIEGVCPMIFHAWNCDAVEGKANGPKGSRSKKTDNVESYVYRNSSGEICLPGVYLQQSIATAAKYMQDPRSPRKSAMDLFKAGICPLTEFASLGSKDWDYLDRRRAVVQRAGITRQRPAFNAGWRATFHMQVLIPEYISPATLNEAIQRAGRLVGVADHRPTYGRFNLTKFEVVG